MARKIEGFLYYIKYKSGGNVFVELKEPPEERIAEYLAELCFEERYCVVEDLQGADFGMYRDFTVEEWRQQAIEWATMDENDDYVEILENMPCEEVLDYIAEQWTVVFGKSKIQSVYFVNSDCKKIRMKMLTSKEFKRSLKAKMTSICPIK